MKRTIALLMGVLLLAVLVPSVAYATDEGEMEIVTEPETIHCAVGDIVKVNFYLYPNLPENILMNSVQGKLIYDPEMLTFGAINTKDEDENLRSFLEDGKSTMRAENYMTPGEILFGYIDVYGWKGQGFWIQVEFRVEQEGACIFLFNGILYSGIDQETNKSISYYIEPKQAGAITTGDDPVPTDAEVNVTYEPLAPEISTTPTPSPTQRPQNSGQTVPQTSSVPLPSGVTLPTSNPNPTGPLTMPPVVTPTPSPTRIPSSATKVPVGTAAAELPEESPQASAQQGESMDPVSEGTAKPQEPTGLTAAPAPETSKTTQEQPSNLVMTVVIIAGIALVVLLALLAIVLILMRKRRLEAENEEE